MATNCVSVHGTYIALEPSLDGKEPTAFKAVVLSLASIARIHGSPFELLFTQRCLSTKIDLDRTGRSELIHLAG